MRSSKSALRTLSLAVPLALLFLSGTASAQTGTVLGKQKISDTQGNFSGVLGNLDEFGGAVAGLGDLDGAGPSVAAIAVGVIGDDDGGTDRGAVYVLLLDGAGAVLSEQKISDTQGGFTATLDNADEFGGSVVGLGDLDGPGPSVAALAVGAALDDDGGTNRGALYVLFLDATGNVLSHQKISDSAGGFLEPLGNADEFGGALAYLGDLDGAGPSVAAIAVGAIGDDDGGGGRGAVYVLFLAATGNVLSYQKISDTQGGFLEPLGNSDEFGSSTAALGDLDGAGPSVAALAVGAIGDDDGGTDRGAVYTLFLNTTGNVLSYQKISSTQGGFTGPLDNADEFGGNLTSLGDLDGSGGSAVTLVVGTPADDDGGLDRGAAYVLFLNPTGTVLSHQKISHTSGGLGGVLADEDQFGASVTDLGDIDGAGGSARALVVGASADDDGGEDRGAVYVLFIDGVSVTGAPHSQLGARIATLGTASPNPFRPSTSIAYVLERTAHVRMDVWDVAGRSVRGLVDEDAGAGEHRVVWNGADDGGRRVPSGTYFIRLTVDGGTMIGSRKVHILR